ncbi:hypothetical protein VNI00_012469 [Paramarasmius palmivorus]|uniref:DUF6697 domain-containing protein n=1 Tax=Paramarasmius palmivorus TaxID=297713 RepID=A0AAW0C559_9AGAR
MATDLTSPEPYQNANNVKLKYLPDLLANGLSVRKRNQLNLAIQVQTQNDDAILAHEPASVLRAYYFYNGGRELGGKEVGPLPRFLWDKIETSDGSNGMHRSTMKSNIYPIVVDSDGSEIEDTKFTAKSSSLDPETIDVELLDVQDRQDDWKKKGVTAAPPILKGSKGPKPEARPLTPFHEPTPAIEDDDDIDPNMIRSRSISLHPQLTLKRSSSPSTGCLVARGVGVIPGDQSCSSSLTSASARHASIDAPRPPHIIAQNIHVKLPNNEELVCASRHAWSILFGGNIQSTFTHSDPTKLPDPRYRRFMFINSDYNPDAPRYPGTSGTLLRRAGTETEVVNGEKYAVVVQNAPNKWRLVGLAEVTRSEDNGVNHWRRMSRKCKDTWISSTNTKRSGAGIEIKARIVLRKEFHQEPTPQEVAAAVLEEKVKLKGKGKRAIPFGEVTKKDIEDAFDSGKAVTYAIRCLEYPLQIQKRVVAMTLTIDGSHAIPRKRAKPAKAAIENHEHDVAHLCGLDGELSELSELTDSDFEESVDTHNSWVIDDDRTVL